MSTSQEQQWARALKSDKRQAAKSDDAASREKELDETLKKVVKKVIDEKIKPEAKKELEEGVKNMASQMAARQLGEGLARQAALQNLTDQRQTQDVVENFSEEEQAEEPKQNIPKEKPAMAPADEAPAPKRKQPTAKQTPTHEPESDERTPEVQQPAPETAPTASGQQPETTAENAAPETAAPSGEEQAGQPNLPEGSRPMDGNGQKQQPGGEAPTDKKPEKNYEPEGQMIQLNRGEKSGLTQNINQLRNRGEIKEIDNNIKTAEKEIKDIAKKLKKPLKELQKMQREKSRQQGTLFLLKLVKALLYIFGLLGVTLAAVPFIKSAIAALKKKQELLENKIKAQKKEIETAMNSKAQANIKIANLEQQRRNVINQF